MAADRLKIALLVQRLPNHTRTYGRCWFCCNIATDKAEGAVCITLTLRTLHIQYITLLGSIAYHGSLPPYHTMSNLTARSSSLINARLFQYVGY